LVCQVVSSLFPYTTLFRSDFFNSWSVSMRTNAWSDANSPQTRLAGWVGSGLSDVDIIKNLFLAALTRSPSDAEVAAIMSRKQARSEEHTSELQSHLNLVCR